MTFYRIGWRFKFRDRNMLKFPSYYNRFISLSLLLHLVLIRYYFIWLLFLILNTHELFYFFRILWWLYSKWFFPFISLSCNCSIKGNRLAYFIYLINIFIINTITVKRSILYFRLLKIGLSSAIEWWIGWYLIYFHCIAILVKLYLVLCNIIL